MPQIKRRAGLATFQELIQEAIKKIPPVNVTVQCLAGKPT